MQGLPISRRTFLGVLIYLIAYHQGMAERSNKEAQQAQAQLDDYVRQTAGSGGAASEIEKAKGLLDSGAITQAEFDAIKAKALSTWPASLPPTSRRSTAGRELVERGDGAGRRGDRVAVRAHPRHPVV